MCVGDLSSLTRLAQLLIMCFGLRLPLELIEVQEGMGACASDMAVKTQVQIAPLL